MERNAPAIDNDRKTASGGRISRLAWRSLRISRALAIVLLLTVSLAANATLFVGGVIYNVVDDVFESITGLETATSKQRKTADDLKRKNRQYINQNRTLQNRIDKLRKVTNAAVGRTVARSTRAVGRAVATAPAKALPYVGIAVVVGATTWEITDLCDTIRDMKEIQNAVDPTISHSEAEQSVCGMRPPTKDEIWHQVTTAPDAAWHHIRIFLPDLDAAPIELETWLDQRLSDGEILYRNSLQEFRRLLSGPDEVNGD